MQDTATDSIHGIHSYPCSFPPSTPRSLLEGDGVFLDPFCGSGTALVEAARNPQLGVVVGWDCNPIAVLIARYKTLDLTDEFMTIAGEVSEDLRDRSPTFQSSEAALHEFPGRDHWFGEQTQRELAAILAWIEEVSLTEAVKTWLTCTLSSIVTRVSFQDSDTRYARVDRDVAPGRPSELFVQRAASLFDALVERGPLGSDIRVELVDVMSGFPAEDETVDEIVTSPPYANTMDYYLYHKQRMNILGFDFKQAQKAEIGSRWEFSSMKAGAPKWVEDLKWVVNETARVLRPGGKATLIIGDSQIAGELIDISSVIVDLAQGADLQVEVNDSVPMEQRSRSFNASFQRPNKFEHTITLSRGA